MKIKRSTKTWAIHLLFLIAVCSIGCGKRYTENKAVQRELVPADQDPAYDNVVSITTEGDSRLIRSNSVPKHKIGKFPNEGNPNRMTEQRVDLKLPLNPTANEQSTPAQKAVGILLNGVFVESGTGESWTRGGQRWNYEALGGAINFGLDENHAHVQPGGKYHYHGQPTGLLANFDMSPEKHSPLIGWAFDGFPIYALFGYSDPLDPESEIAEMTSSFRLKKGDRPAEPAGPGGTYDGAFVQDYEFVDGAGTLDECNGRYSKTPEFPDGTYAYFLTKQWPVILRNYRGTPAQGGPPGSAYHLDSHPHGHGDEHVHYPAYRPDTGEAKEAE